MILPATGEVIFSDGLHFSPHEPLSVSSGTPRRPFGLVRGWSKYVLGKHSSDHGEFEVEVVCDTGRRIETVAVAHIHPFYERETAGDSERHAYHEGIIATDLRGQREFSWGMALSCLDTRANKDWLVVVYTAELHVPLRRAEFLRHLYEHEPVPES